MELDLLAGDRPATRPGDSVVSRVRVQSRVQEHPQLSALPRDRSECTRRAWLAGLRRIYLPSVGTGHFLRKDPPDVDLLVQPARIAGQFRDPVRGIRHAV